MVKIMKVSITDLVCQSMEGMKCQVVEEGKSKTLRLFGHLEEMTEREVTKTVHI